MGSISTITDELHGHDQEQIALMEERLILLDRDDNAIGEESKKTCKFHHHTPCKQNKQKKRQEKMLNSKK